MIDILAWALCGTLLWLDPIFGGRESEAWAPTLTAQVVGVVCGRETVHVSLCIGDILIGAVIDKNQLWNGDVAPRQTFRVYIESGLIEMYATHYSETAEGAPLIGGLVMMG